jgi:hypothetical protein
MKRQRQDKRCVPRAQMQTPDVKGGHKQLEAWR